MMDYDDDHDDDTDFPEQSEQPEHPPAVAAGLSFAGELRAAANATRARAASSEAKDERRALLALCAEAEQLADRARSAALRLLAELDALGGD